MEILQLIERKLNEKESSCELVYVILYGQVYYSKMNFFLDCEVKR